ncbi:MAG: hypothetical protein J2P57_02425 [Acidimicrobiaceae bacterium]|nr:hypothetical protein [Acidimicrobiaceae bacterium]
MSVKADPQAIRSLAGSFRAAAAALSQEAVAFSEQANLHSNAFGTLPAGKQAYADYMERLQQSTGSVKRLTTTLQQIADNLETSAANWEQADHGSITG